MSDWVYVAGEGGFFQDFLPVDQITDEAIDMTGATVTMFIQDSGLSTNFPTDGNGELCTVTIRTSDGKQVARLTVATNFMPQTEGIYVAQLKIAGVAIIRSYIINLRVIRQVGNT